jgi:hypothetical protein
VGFGSRRGHALLDLALDGQLGILVVRPFHDTELK